MAVMTTWLDGTYNLQQQHLNDHVFIWSFSARVADIQNCDTAFNCVWKPFANFYELASERSSAQAQEKLW